MCISFSKKGTDEVKQFIMQHYLNQMFDEYTAIPEPLSDFYDVLCIGLDWNDESPLLSPHNYSQPLPLDPGSCFPSSYEIFDWLLFTGSWRQLQRETTMKKREKIKWKWINSLISRRNWVAGEFPKHHLQDRSVKILI